MTITGCMNSGRLDDPNCSVWLGLIRGQQMDSVRPEPVGLSCQAKASTLCGEIVAINPQIGRFDFCCKGLKQPSRWQRCLKGLASIVLCDKSLPRSQSIPRIHYSQFEHPTFRKYLQTQNTCVTRQLTLCSP